MYSADSIGDLGSKEEGVVPRTVVSGAEIRWECFGSTSAKGGNDNSARRIANIMNNMPGWRKIKKPYRDKLYGIVRGWERESE